MVNGNVSILSHITDDSGGGCCLGGCLGIVTLIVALAAVTICLSSCSRRTITTTTSSEVKDSVRIEYVQREVEVVLPGDTVRIETIIECDSVTNKPRPMQLRARGKRSTTKVKLDTAGKLTVTNECDSLREKMKLLDRQLFHYKHERQTTATDSERIVYKTRTIDKFCRGFTLVVILCIIIGIILKVKGFL